MAQLAQASPTAPVPPQNLEAEAVIEEVIAEDELEPDAEEVAEEVPDDAFDRAADAADELPVDSEQPDS